MEQRKFCAGLMADLVEGPGLWKETGMSRMVRIGKE